MTTRVSDDVYYEQERPEVLGLVPHDVRRALELGCANGRMAEVLKARQSCHVTGIESIPSVAARAEARLDRVITGDCEQLEFADLFAGDEFDCVIAADVLEHLRDPEDVLRRLLPHLTDTACIVVSLPNVRHAGVLESAVQGHWTYQKWGILDRTHLRFFTRREVIRLFARLGFQVECVDTVDAPQIEEWERLHRPNCVSFGAMSIKDLREDEVREFFVVQWLVRARRTPLRIEISDEASAVLDGAAPKFTVAESIVPQLRTQVVQERAYAEHVHAELRRAVRLAADRLAEVGRVSAQLSALTTENAHLLQQLGQRTAEMDALRAAYSQAIFERDVAHSNLLAMRTSTSWRVTAPLRAAVTRRFTVRRVVDRVTRGRPRLRRVARLGARVMARQTTSPASAEPGATMSAHLVEHRSAYSLVPIVHAASLRQARAPARRRVICFTHILPYPPSAGNEYRVDRMLDWLASNGWSVLLLIHPMYAQPPSEQQFEQLVERFANVVICDPDGTLRYRLQDDGAMLEGLRGRQPRDIALLLGESEGGTSEERRVVQLLRQFCPDFVAEVLLHLDEHFQPDVVLAEYIFMLRAFPLLRRKALKAVDTIDVFSSKTDKVERFGFADQLALSARAETSLLERADLIISIQSSETEVFRTLVPDRKVVTVGVDFPTADGTVKTPSGCIVVMVGSSNPMNVKGMRDFLRFAWPLVTAEIPDAEFRIAGSVADATDPQQPGVRVLGRVEDLNEVYSAARVVINPTIAGTGLKIKTVEALCQKRPVVLWPAGVEGLPDEVKGLCNVARDWHDFAWLVIKHLRAEEYLAEPPVNIADVFAADRVYAPLAEALSPA